MSAAATGPGLPVQVGLGLAAAALFSSTFVLNRAMSLAGGPWVWNAVLRYADMAVLLAGFVAWRHGPARLVAVVHLFRARLGLWLLAGGVGFGVFYLGVCFAGAHGPGWLVAATWQSTVVCTPLVLRLFGTPVPPRGLLALAVILAGIALLGGDAVRSGLPTTELLWTAIPVGVAALAYPFGNQLLNRARFSIPDPAGLLRDPACCVLLMTAGAMPVLLAALAIEAPPMPTTGQWLSTGLVALLSGCGATTLFLGARNLSPDPQRIAAVDATQAAEMGFALLGEVAFLHADWPGAAGWAGLAVVGAGLLGFVLSGR